MITQDARMDGCSWSGGGDKFAFEVGVGIGLSECGVMPYVHGGTSAGAFVSSGAAMHEPEEFGVACTWMSDIVYEIKGKRDIYKHHPVPYLGAINKPSLFNAEPLQEMIRDMLDHDQIKSTATHAMVTAVDTLTGEIRVFDKFHPDFVNAVIASGMFPLAFQPVDIKYTRGYWTDGFLDVSPLSHLIHTGANRVFATITKDVRHFPKVAKKDLQGVIPMGKRLLKLYDHDVLRNDIKKAELVNRLVELGRIAQSLVSKCERDPEVDAFAARLLEIAPFEYDPVEIITITPPEPIESSLDFNPDQLRRQVDIGYDAAIKAMVK